MTKPDHVQTLIEGIETSLKSASTITSQTLQSLKSLLATEADDKSINPATIRLQPAERPARPVSKAVKIARTTNRKVRQPQDFEIYEAPDCTIIQLPPTKRRKLATNSFNATLKRLTAAAKEKRDPSAIIRPNEKRPTTTVQFKKAKPLEPCSPNRQTKLSTRDCNQLQQKDDIGIVAECASVALDSLQDLDADNVKPGNDNICRQEQGRLVLLDKLITLELMEAASVQVAKVHEQYWKRRKNVTGRTLETKRLPISCIPDFITIQPVPEDRDDFDFCTSFQSQVLRLTILYGPGAITKDFVESISVHHKGSPAALVLLGNQSSFLDDEKTGLQLRTISLALLKLYSRAVSQRQEKGQCPHTMLNLLVQSLLIKCSSWFYLGHKPDLNQGLWITLLQGMKRATKAKDFEQTKAYGGLMEHFKAITCALHENGFETAPSPEVTLFLSDLGERSGCYAESLQLLNMCDTSTRSIHDVMALILLWQKAATRYQSSCKKDNLMLQCYEEALGTFPFKGKIEDQYIEDLLVHGSRVRKACSAIVIEVEEVITKVHTTSAEVALQVCCARFLVRLIAFLHEHLACCLGSTVPAIAHQPRRRSIVMSLAKSIDSVLALRSTKIVTDNVLQDEYNKSIQQCLQLSHILQQEIRGLPPGDVLSVFVQGLPVQCSNFFWARYIRGLEIGSDQPKLLHCLTQSVTSIQPCASSIQRTASLGMKLERLALAHLQAKNTDAARQSFENAIIHYIKIGALADAVETALSESSNKAWSKVGSKSYALGKALGSQSKLALNHNLCSVDSGTWLYDDETLPSIHRCVLLEEQLIACDHEASIDINFRSIFTACVDKILKLCEESKYGIYRSRFILRLLKKAVGHSSPWIREALDDKVINQLLQSEGSELLLAYDVTTRCCLGIEWALQSEHADIEALSQHVQALKTFLSSVSDSTALENSVDDVDFCFHQLKTVLSYARSLGHTSIVIQTLMATKHITSSRFGPTHINLLPTLTHIGSLQRHTGDTVGAGKTFTAGQEITNLSTEPSYTRIRWILAYTEHLIAIGEIYKVEQALKEAKAMFVSVYDRQDSLVGRKRLERDSILSWAARIASRLAFQNGELAQATQYAIRAFRISAAIWRTVDKPQPSAKDTSPLAVHDSTMTSLGAEMSNLTLLSDTSSSQCQTRGPAFWEAAELQYESLAGLTHISLHNGCYQDTLQYGQLLEKLAISVDSPVWSHKAAALLALLQAKANHKEEALALLQSISPKIDKVVDLGEVYNYTIQIEAFLEVGDSTSAANLLSELEIRRVSQVQPSIQQESISKQTDGRGRHPLRGKLASVHPVKAAAKHPAQRRLPAPITIPHGAVRTGRSQDEKFDDRMLMLRNMLYLARMNLVDDTELNSEPETTCAAPYSMDSQVTSSMIMLQKGLQELSSDPVKCVLAETAVALPVRYKSSRRSGRVSFLQIAELPVAPKVRKNARAKPDAKAPVLSTQHASSGEQLLLDAQKLLQAVSRNSSGLCSSELLHVAGKIKSKLALLSSTINSPFNSTSLQLVRQSMLPKDIVLFRDKLIIEAEHANNEREQVYTWPISLSEPSDDRASKADEQVCNADMLDDIPESWSIISLSLAEDQQEMLVSKIQANKSPFLLRIPLSRPDIEAEDFDDFSFPEAMSELHEIITQANDSCHDRRGQGNKETRLKWYAERQALDKRLETLLRNVENIWLGGFRGLMTAHKVDDMILAKFGEALSQILDQHLPSRQKSSKSSGTKVELHAHVLQLFLGLGNPDEQEMDDAVTDLLYFVVDILQFSDERNAYDEIDFDAMLVEVLDALRSCHSILQLEQNPVSGHTILIIDKELASVPWESLPCMQQQSVSRMPSLSAILDRLKKIREQDISYDGYSLSATQGAYMLNPSSDLISTQSTFQPILQTHLPTYAATINKPPTESEFEATLHSNELFLYFGHGAGAQYIRGRKIRSLKQCAVTLLMGCSSAKMTECGKLESYGMPGYYINGLSGCMSVVGTLWDVTDRDIDRFALKLMLEWGLVPEDEVVGKALEKPRKKGQVVDKKGKSKDGIMGVEAKRGRIALDTAVNKGREACALRYLNGAAPVVYGVPVYLR